MMTELSLNILDVTENSVRAGAALITLSVVADFEKDRLVVTIKDNGSGMSEEQVNNVTDPFFTTRTTRKVGLGVPFFKLAAESTGGSFTIRSNIGVGTEVEAVFTLSHIDRMPMGDLTATVHTLITMHPEIDFIFEYSVDGRSFKLETSEMREILGGIPLNEPEVSTYIKDYLAENISEINGYLTI